MQSLADEIASLGRDVVIVFTEDLEIVFSNGTQMKNNRKEKSEHTISISPLISPARSKLSSFFPRARVWLWISVAK
jgi:hypothetical protein